jgi:plasmid maintenance system antidote protein VapI
MPALSNRVPLHAPEALRFIMSHPGRGTPYTVRSLAEAADCKPATIGHLLSGRQRSTDQATALRIAGALGCDAGALFILPSSTDLDKTSKELA